MDYPTLFVENDQIQNILSVVSSSAQIKFECKACDYTSVKKELMRQHSLVKHSGIVNKCPSCDYTHYFPGKVRGHYKQVHLKMRNLTRNYNQCEFIASYRDQLDTHIAYEHEGRVFRCDNCDFIGKNRHNLRNHLFSHHKEKVYNCDKCEYKCAEKSSLKKHSLGHSRIICNECDHVTFSKKDLQKHKKSHHGIPYSCSQCPFNTKQRSNKTK